jgi:hypothetical protein
MKIENGKVVDRIGTVLAEKIRGEWHTKSDVVMLFILASERGDPVPQEEGELEMVRARDKKGHYISDDPTTEKNEAWVVKTVKKVLKK